jgi:hypothetical protein
MMSEKLITANIASVVAAQTLPGITIWNRLEGRPRAEKFDRALRAEVRDALWMLTRQWQMGEFRGDDAGSPIFAKVRVETTRLRKYQSANGSVEEFNDVIPLEACYLGWQESLQLLAQLVEPEIPDGVLVVTQ